MPRRNPGFQRIAKPSRESELRRAGLARDASALAFPRLMIHSPGMFNTPDSRRRWLGVMFLALAAGLLIWGQTVFEPHLKGLGFIAYYGICFLFTMLAILTALLDLWIIRTRTRSQRRELIQRTLGEISEATQSSARGQIPAGEL